jgi:hypothetical protein
VVLQVVDILGLKVSFVVVVTGAVFVVGVVVGVVLVAAGGVVVTFGQAIVLRVMTSEYRSPVVGDALTWYL